MRSRLEVALLVVGLSLVLVGGAIVSARRDSLPRLALPVTVQPSTPTPGPTAVPARGLDPSLTPAPLGSPPPAGR
jgi:hypothetical protein